MPQRSKFIIIIISSSSSISIIIVELRRSDNETCNTSQ